MDLAPPQTVADWTARGYRGLRVMRCLDCPGSTYRTWSELAAEPHEDVVEVARRMRCQGCGQPPAGLAVVTYRDVEDRLLRQAKQGAVSVGSGPQKAVATAA